MTFSSLKRLRIVVGGVGLTALLVLLFLVGTGLRERLADRVQRDSTQRSRRMPLENVSYRELVGENLHDSFRAQTIVHQNKKLGPLAVNRLTEIHMRHVEIELASETSSLGDVTRLVRKAVADQELGLVTLVRIEGLSVVRRSDEQALFTLHAGVAEIDVTQRRLLLTNQVSIRSGSGEQLSALSASWNRRTRRLRVRGPFYFNGAAHRDPNTEVEFSIDANGRLVREAPLPADQGSGQPSQSQSSTRPSPNPVAESM